MGQVSPELIFGWQANPAASLEDLCQSARVCGVEISPQGLQERLNSPEANDFLYRLLMRALSYVVRKRIGGDLLEQFNGVYIQDSSTIELPSPFEHCGRLISRTRHTQSTDAIGLPAWTAGMEFGIGRRHDCPLQTLDLPAGSLRLADIGYFKMEVFEQLNQQGVCWVSRVPARAGFWTGEQVIHPAL